MDDPIAKPGTRSGCAVMHLVRMQDMTLLGKTVPPDSPVLERLHSGQRQSDPIGVMAMRRKPVAADMNLRSFDPGAPLSHADSVAEIRELTMQPVFETLHAMDITIFPSRMV
jgi:hypothetical protein